MNLHATIAHSLPARGTTHRVSAPPPTSCRRVYSRMTMSGVELAKHPTPARYVREKVKLQLAALGLADGAGDFVESVLVIVSELVTNAYRHAGGAQSIRVTYDTGNVTIEVDDTTPTETVITPDDERGAVGGYGMVLVDTLADDWGVTPRPGGKTVYSHIRLP